MLYVLCIMQPNNETIPLIQTMDMFELSDFIRKKKYESLIQFLECYTKVIHCCHNVPAYH